MKLFIRTALLTILVITLLAPAAVLAQDECYGLSEADCALFNNMGPVDPSSFAFSYAFSISISGDEAMSITSEGAGNMTIDLAAEDPMAGLNMALVANGYADGEGGEVELFVIDGVFYLKILAEGMEDQWMFISLEDAIEMSGVPMDMMDPEMIAGGMGDMDAAMEQLGPLADTVLGYYSVVRGADQELNGENLAVFESAYDIAGLIADPGLANGLIEMMKAQPELLAGMGMGDAATMTEEEIEQAASGMGMLVMMLGMMFQETDLSFNTYVNPETANFAGIDLHFAMTMDPSMLGMGEGDAVEPIGVELDLSLYVGDYDVEFEYVAPEGAIEMTEENMEKLFGSMDMGL